MHSHQIKLGVEFKVLLTIITTSLLFTELLDQQAIEVFDIILGKSGWTMGTLKSVCMSSA
jgi:hypothetical protein